MLRYITPTRRVRSDWLICRDFSSLTTSAHRSLLALLATILTPCNITAQEVLLCDALKAIILPGERTYGSHPFFICADSPTLLHHALIRPIEGANDTQRIFEERVSRECHLSWTSIINQPAFHLRSAATTSGGSGHTAPPVCLSASIPRTLSDRKQRTAIFPGNTCCVVALSGACQDGSSWINMRRRVSTL